MVNFDSVTIGLEVEFQADDGTIERGFVRYKGPINGKPGDWVGIEANRSVGYCDGRIMGRTYFKCPDGFGLFLSANDIRLASKIKKKKSSLYKSVDSQCDELLFKQSMPKEKLNSISQEYLRRAKSAFEFHEDYASVFSSAPKFAIRDSLVIAQKKKKEPIKKQEKTFQPVASVRRSFMPQEEMQLYSKINWSYKNKTVSLPREKNNLSTTFDGFNKQRSNYIDPAL